MRTTVILALLLTQIGAVLSFISSPQSFRSAISRPFESSAFPLKPSQSNNKPSWSSRESPLFIILDEDDFGVTVDPSDQLVLGIGGTLAALITFYSEYTLKTTGCGLPAGPFGLVGLVEGLSYLGVTGIAAFAIVKKLKTGSGLPAGPAGLLGAAEGLSFLAILIGIVVLVLQVTNYGYIPNAVPMEGGMCS